jgi:hypothetical protein
MICFPNAHRTGLLSLWFNPIHISGKVSLQTLSQGKIIRRFDATPIWSDMNRVNRIAVRRPAS